MQQMRVLVVGAGIAGATLASLLGRRGHHVTVVERDRGRRSSGSPVDVRGAALDTVTQLGVLPALRSAATAVTDLILVDTTGRPVARMPTQRPDRADLEVPRADLAAALLDSCPAAVTMVFDDEPISIEPGTDEVLVGFHRSEPGRFDLVVGADGVHSRTRELVWGPESRYSRPLGMYIATVRLPEAADRRDAVLMYNEPGRASVVHPTDGRPGAAFLFRSRVRVDPRDRTATDALLRATYRSAGWRSVPLLERYLAADDAYFDAVTRVRVPGWNRGRVVLLGDAASCVSLFGEGSSAAISGAARLADALDAHSDLGRALAAYETAHRRAIGPALRRWRLAAHVVIPATAAEIAARNTLLRLVAGRPDDRLRPPPAQQAPGGTASGGPAPSTASSTARVTEDPGS